MRILQRLMHMLSVVCVWLGGIAIVVMMVQVTLDVVLKYLFNKPVPATLELVSFYYMVAIIFLPLGLITEQEKHLEVEVFYDLMPRWLQSIFTSIAMMVSAVYVGLMCYRTTKDAIHATRIGETGQTAVFDMMIWPSRWFVAIGCALAFSFFVLHACKAVTTLFFQRA